jgi:hypothetical protein
MSFTYLIALSVVLTLTAAICNGEVLHKTSDFLSAIIQEEMVELDFASQECTARIRKEGKKKAEAEVGCGQTGIKLYQS